MNSKINFHYKILEKLGDGGMSSLIIKYDNVLAISGSGKMADQSVMARLLVKIVDLTA